MKNTLRNFVMLAVFGGVFEDFSAVAACHSTALCAAGRRFNGWL